MKAFYNRFADDIKTLVAGGKNPRLSLKINVRDYLRIIRLEHDLQAGAVRNLKALSSNPKG